MKCFVIFICLAFVVFEVRSDLEGFYKFAETCIKELELDINNYSKLLDKADDDGIDHDDIYDLRKAPEGACILKCMLVKKGFFKANGEINMDGPSKDLLAGIDIKVCEAIKNDDLCEEVVQTSLCISKQRAAKNG